MSLTFNALLQNVLISNIIFPKHLKDIMKSIFFFFKLFHYSYKYWFDTEHENPLLSWCIIKKNICILKTILTESCLKLHLNFFKTRTNLFIHFIVPNIKLCN